MGEKDKLSFEAIKLSAANTLRKGLALAGSVIALSGNIAVNQALFHPAEAIAAEECTTTTTTTSDGTTTTTTETTHCTDSPDSSDEGDQSGSQQPSKPPKHQPNHPKGPKHGGSIKQPKTEKPERDWPIGFVNYNQGDWSHPDTGCGPTSIAMILATLEGNRHITPNTVTSKISPEWYSPGNSGTAAGAFFDMGRRYDLAVKNTSFHNAEKVLQAGGLAIVHAAQGSGHFTMNGHYMVLKRFSHGRFRIADPNGNGYSNDSEVRWWSPSALKANGIDDVWTFRPKS